MKRNYLIYILLCILFLSTSSCKDDLLYGGGEAGEGKCVISGTVKFKSFTPALNGSTRTPGNAIKEINSLCVLLYDANTENPGQSKLVNKYFLKPEGTSGADGYYKVTSVNRETNTGQEETSGEETSLPSLAEAETRRATFKLTVPYGNYYIYAVANMDILSSHESEIQTVDGLKNISLQWNTDDITANSQMFGHFFSTDNTTTEAPLLTINQSGKSGMELFAWVRRAASKVTVAFDGSKLEEGVTIRLRKLRIKRIPSTCYLGKDNTVGEGGFIETGEEVDYATVAYTEEPLVTKELPYYPRKEEEKSNEDGTTMKSWIMDPGAHSETNLYSLFFYENMQGEGPDKRQSDANKDGALDEIYKYQDKPYATYIEVETYYESTNPQNPGMSNITYRFMLGQDIIKDYNAKRNCHYKLTLCFNRFADDPDWRIDYVTRFGVTQPERVDYRGKYFVPDNITSNQGNNFSSDNVIALASFMYDKDSWESRIPVNYKIEYKDAGNSEFTETCPDWFNFITTPVTDKNGKETGVYNLKINYKNEYTSLDINETLSDAPEKGSSTNPYDLSTKGGTESSMNTANCYIVDSKGTYQFPLVYGNAITNGATNTDAYTYKAWGSGERYLTPFKNYIDRGIAQPYILTDIYGNNVPDKLSASLVWQDEQSLIEPSSINYVPGAYNKNGGIQFTINNIKEGNAVIALKDPNGTIMWSWHIWVTAIDFTKGITIKRPGLAPDAWNSWNDRNFEIMPVNLGWCSGNIPIRYYARHECEVKFTQIIDEGQEGVSQTVKIIQEPHIAVPCGNNPYFQWGRKDPFIAAGSGNETTKDWYDASNSLHTSAPTLMYTDESSRVKTINATASLIKNPDKWQNPPHEHKGGTKYEPVDEIFVNLWDNNCWNGDAPVIKTIYDPCPVGYHVSSVYTFAGFTDYGGSITDGKDDKDIKTQMYAATEENMMPSDWVDSDKYNENVVEFYTDRTKLISIGFPANGYRDWDDYAKVWQYGQGEIWHAQTSPYFKGPYNAYHLEFTRDRNNFTPHIFPWNNFYATDGMSVRPTKRLTE